MGFPYGGAAGVIVDTINVDKAKFRSWTGAIEDFVAASFDTVADFLADTDLTYTTGGPTASVLNGDLILIRREGIIYEVAASGATDNHSATAGAVKVYEGGVVYTTRARMGAAHTRSAFPNGTRLWADGVEYIADSTATGVLSALNDLSVNGIRLAVPAWNNYLAAWSQQDATNADINFFTSPDGDAFQRLNANLISHGNSGQVLNSGTPFMFWNDVTSEFWIIVTNYSYGVWDSVIYRSEDMITWRRSNVIFGSSAIASASVPITGGTQPADLIWSPKFFRDTDGTLYVTYTVRYGNDFVDAYGVTVKHKRVFYSTCTDESALTFSAPTQLDFGADTQAMIDAHIVKVGSVYWLATKDENTKRIRFYSGSSIAGTWTYDQELTGTHKIEGPTLVKHRRYASGVLEEVWRCYVDAHNDTSGNLVGVPYYFEASALGGTWGSETLVTTSAYVRHGSVLNLAVDTNPKAAKIAEQAKTILGGQNRENIMREVALSAGAETIYPQEGSLYYAAGTGNITTLTIANGPAESFYLASLSAGNGTGIIVEAGTYCSSQVMIGFGFNSDQYIKMVRKEDGKYYAEGNQPRAYFRAHKNGTAQNVTVDTPTLVTFGTESRDLGSHYDVSTSKWTPPAGRYRVCSKIVFFNAIAANDNYLMLYKNGAVTAQSVAYTTAGNMTLTIDEIVEANGTDYFEIYVDLNGSGTKTITGAAINTYFEGGPA